MAQLADSSVTINIDNPAVRYDTVSNAKLLRGAIDLKYAKTDEETLKSKSILAQTQSWRRYIVIFALDFT